MSHEQKEIMTRYHFQPTLVSNQIRFKRVFAKKKTSYWQRRSLVFWRGGTSHINFREGRAKLKQRPKILGIRSFSYKFPRGGGGLLSNPPLTTRLLITKMIFLWIFHHCHRKSSVAKLFSAIDFLSSSNF